MHIIPVKNYCILVGMIILSGCATQRSSYLNAPWSFPNQSLQAVSDWDIQGNVIFRSRNHSHRATLLWQQRGERFFIQLNHPLGIHSIQLIGDAHHAELKSSDGQRWKTDQPEVLLQQKLGILLPMKSMSAWVRGLPSQSATTNRPILRFNEKNQLTYLQQDEWQLHYQNYHPYGRWTLPQRVDCIYKHFRIHFVIRKWVLIDKKIEFPHN